MTAFRMGSARPTPTSSTPIFSRSSPPEIYPFPKNSSQEYCHMRLVIIGSGFAGMYAALSAARLRGIAGVSSKSLEIAIVSPEPVLVIRPRLYEAKPETLAAPLREVFRAIDVVFVQGSAEAVDTKSQSV